MSARPLPPDDRLNICFAHGSYRLQERFLARNSGLRSFEVRTLDDLKARVAEADVLVASVFWRNELIASAPKLAFIQSVSAGTDQFSREMLREAGIRLASAQGVNEVAVAHHAMALILAMARQLPQARDNQRAHVWRGAHRTIADREQQLGGRTLVIVGMGRIGSRLAKLAHAFDMRVIGVKRNPSHGVEAADEAVATADLPRVLPRADFVALTFPLTPETQGLIGTQAFAAMKRSAVLVNVGRGKVVDEAALIEAMRNRTIAAAALDCTPQEPLAQDSPIWDLPGVFVTPHTAGDSHEYEDNVIDILLENLRRLRQGESSLKNGIV